MKISPDLPAVAVLASVLISFSTPLRAQAGPADPAWAALEQSLGGGLQRRPIARNSRGVELVGNAAVSPPIAGRDDARDVARRVIELASDALGVTSGELFEIDLREIAGTYAFRFEQRVGTLPVSLPVIGSRVDVRLTREGRLTILRAAGLVRGSLEKDFAVGRGDAGELARVSIPGVPLEKLWASGARKAVVAREAGGSPRARGVWQVEVSDPTEAAGSWLVTLDGANGETIDVAPLALESLAGSGVSGTIDGRGTASGPQGVGAPTTLPMAHLDVASVDSSAAIVDLTNNACRDEQAVISADGTKVAYVSNCDGDREICVVGSNGTGFLQLTTNGADDHSPAISADGSRIAFVSHVGGDAEIVTVLSNGTGLLALTTNAVADRAPSISGDGTRVVYESNAGGDFEIFRVLTSGTAPVQLTTNGVSDLDPDISGDGSKIAWVSHVDGDAEIFVMDWTGGSVTQLTMNSVEDRQPALADDGSLVVFGSRLPFEAPAPTDPSIGGTTSHAGGRVSGTGLREPFDEFDLFQIATAGTGLRRLTSGDGNEDVPSLAGSGPWTAYSVAGGRDVFLLDAVSGASLRVADTAAVTARPSVSADWRDGVFTASDGDFEIRAWHLGASGAAFITSTDTGGNYALDIPDGGDADLFLRLRGAYASVRDEHPDASRLSASGSVSAPGTLDLHFNPSGDDEYKTSQVSAYRHTTKAHDDVAAILRRPPLSIGGPLGIDTPLVARVNSPSPVANAFYNVLRKDTTYFMGAGPSRPNTAYDSVIYHEYGHFFDDSFGGIGTTSPCEAAFATSEGIGDILSTYLTGSASVGEGFFGPGTAIRDYETFPWFGGPTGAKGRQYDCLDCPSFEGKPKPHHHGQALAGFAWDLREDLGLPLAEDLVFGALTANPPSMQAAVTEVFVLASEIYGGTPATSPFYDSICLAAAKHGFDCVPRGDWGTYGCIYGVCSGLEAIHRTTGTEWLGPIVDWESGCEPLFNPDDDGVFVPPALWSGESFEMSVTIKVDPALKHTGRYGVPLEDPALGAQLPARRVYLNAWLFMAEGGGVISTTKVLGTGSENEAIGPDAFETGPGGLLNAIAFNPDTWAGDSYVFTFTLDVPTVTEPRSCVLRFRLDWGEDAGRIETCLTDELYTGACGPARFGEVEDYQLWIEVP